MKIANFGTPSAILTRRADQTQPPETPPSDPSDKPSIDWNSVGKSALQGAGLYGIPAALGAVNPVAGMVGAVGVGAYAAYTTGNPRALILAAFIGMPAANVGAHWGPWAAVGVASLGALSVGLSNYLDQRREQQ